MDPQQYNNQPQMILPGQDQFGQQISGQQISGQPMSGQTMQGQSIPEQMMQGQPMPGQMTPGQGLMQEPAQILMPQGQPMPGQMAQTQMYAQGQMPQNQNAAALGSAAMAANQTPASSHESPTSTQATLMISELRDNVVIMKDGSFRAVVACKSINFDLMSDMEREGVEYSYQNFLNSLKFTVQILIRSQRVDIGPYLERLNEIRRNNDNMLLGVLMDDYINFIDVLSQEANIMDKSFFVVVPYYSSPDAEKAIQETKNLFKMFSKSKGQTVTRIDRATYDKALSELTNRVDAVMSGLFQIGVHSVRLNTKELAELYYNFNNPDTAVREPLVDFSRLATMYVKGGQSPNNGGTVNG